MTNRLALSWSGGKDSALTLWALRRDGHEPAALVTTVTETYNRISMHGVRRELLARQAEALAIPLVEVAIPPACSNDIYEERLEQAFAVAPLSSVETVAFGDLFLEDIRAYRIEKPRLPGGTPRRRRTRRALPRLGSRYDRARARIHRPRLRSNAHLHRSGRT